MKAWTKWQDWGVLVLGILLVVAPWIFGTATTQALIAWNAGIVGVALVASTLWTFAQASVSATEWGYIAWLQLILGAWLIIAPWLLGFAAITTAAWTAWIIGILVVVISVWKLLEVRRQRTQATTI
jgi:SPW repeat-containing protein